LWSIPDLYEGTDPLLNALRAEGADAALVLGDLNTDAEADHVVSQALDAFEGVDILVNNAGRFFGQPWVDIEPAEWNSIYNNNLTSMVRVREYRRLFGEAPLRKIKALRTTTLSSAAI
jgi:NADP-dependent 3-hydroxy acid dehydrogenase YdfG